MAQVSAGAFPLPSGDRSCSVKCQATSCPGSRAHCTKTAVEFCHLDLKVVASPWAWQEVGESAVQPLGNLIFPPLARPGSGLEWYAAVLPWPREALPTQPWSRVEMLHCPAASRSPGTLNGFLDLSESRDGGTKIN